MLSCNARWYSIPGGPPEFPTTCAPVGVAAGVVHTKWVVSIWILSLHFAFISRSANLTSSSKAGSWTLPKHTQMPDVSVIVCVRTRIRFEGKTPAVVRRMSWKEYSMLISRPESLVEVLVMGDGIAASRCPFLYISRERSLAVASWTAGHSRVMEVWVTFRTCDD